MKEKPKLRLIKPSGLFPAPTMFFCPLCGDQIQDTEQSAKFICSGCDELEYQVQWSHPG